MQSSQNLKASLNSEAKLIRVIKQELLDIKKRFTQPRRSKIEREIEEIKITLRCTCTKWKK